MGDTEPAGDDESFTIVKLRGLPYEATKDNIVQFFDGLNIKEGEDGIFIAKTSVGRASGDGYVEFVDNANAKLALERNKAKIYHRFINIFKSDNKQRAAAVSAPRVVYDISKTNVDPNSIVVRLKGLPWTTKEKDIRDFFDPIELHKVHIIPDHLDRASGEGYVEFKEVSQCEEAMKKDKNEMEGRYVELFKSTPTELAFSLARLNPDVSPDSFLVRMRGLPFDSSENDVKNFFDNAPELKKVHFIQDVNGRASGVAYAEFTTTEAVEVALEKNKEHIGTRYVELFRSSLTEMTASLRRPTNYRRKPYRMGGGRTKSNTNVRPASSVKDKVK